MSASDISRRIPWRRFLLPLLVGVGLAMLLVVLVRSRRDAAVAREFNEMRIAARAVAAGVEGSYRGQGRRGSTDRDRFAAVLESVVLTTGVRFLALFESEGVISAGDVPPGITDRSSGGEDWDGETFLLYRRFRPAQEVWGTRGGGGPPPWRGGRGRRGWRQETEEDAECPMLVVGIADEVFVSELAEAESHMVLASVVGLGIIVLLVGGWVIWIRSRRLFGELQLSRLRSAHLEELGLAAVGLVHETKNPLGIIRGLSQRIADRDMDAAETRETAETILDEVDRTASRLGDFLVFARPPALELEPVDLSKFLREIETLMSSEFETAGLDLFVEEGMPCVKADPDLLKQLIVNLLLNSLHASNEGGSIAMTASRTGATMKLSVGDQGTGIDPAIRDDVWKPYVTGRTEGHGLGLSIVKRIADEHGWSLELKSTPGCGTEVTVTGLLPCDREGARP